MIYCVHRRVQSFSVPHKVLLPLHYAVQVVIIYSLNTQEELCFFLKQSERRDVPHQINFSLDYKSVTLLPALIRLFLSRFFGRQA